MVEHIYGPKGEQLRSLIYSRYDNRGSFRIVDSTVVEPVSFNTQDARVNYIDVLSIPAVWNAIMEISETIASLPIRMYRNYRNGRKDQIERHPFLDLLERGNSIADGYTIRNTQCIHLLLLGNSYSEIEYSVLNDILGLYPTAPNKVVSVNVVRNESGRFQKVFEMAEPLADGRAALSEQEIFHIAAPSLAGVSGANPVDIFGRVFNLMIQTERYGAKFFKNGRPTGLLILPPEVDVDEKSVTDAKNSFMSANMGDNALGLAVMPDGVKYQPVANTPEEAQFNETRQALVLEVARIFRIPASRIGYESNSTYNNREQDAVRYVRDCISPIAKRIESAYQRRFFGVESRITLEHDYEVLLEQQFADKVSSLVELFRAGIYDQNETREDLGKEPVQEEQEQPTEETQDDNIQGTEGNEIST